MVYDQTTGPSGEHPELISDVQITSDPTYNTGETRKGTYTFTYYLPDDGFGNSTTVTINLIIVDDIFPIITLGSTLNFGGLSTPFKSLSLNGNSKIFTFNTNIIDISETLIKEVGYYQLPDATAIDFSGIDIIVTIPDLSGAITPKNSIIEAIYSAIDSANNKTIVNFRYKINDNIFPSFTEISYAIDSTSSELFTIYDNSYLIQLDEFSNVYIKFEVNEVVNFSIYDSSGNFSFIDSNEGVTLTNLKLNDTSPGYYNIIIQADDGVNQTLSTRVLIRINPIPYFTFRIENNGTDNILQVRYKTYIKDGITYNYLNTLTIKFGSPLTNIDLITPAGILINVDGNDGKNFFINNIGTKIISISTSTIVGNALFTNYNDGIFMDLINIGSNDVNIDEILTLFIFDSKDLISGRSFYYIENGSLNAIQDVSILNLINNQIIKNRNINEVYNSEFSNLPNQLIFLNEDYINNFGVGYVDICNNPQTFFDATYNRWFYETLNWANEVSGSSQPPTIQDYHIDHGDGDIIIQSRYKLIPGIINGDQDLGDGLPYAMNIFDPSECILYYLTVIDLDNNILFNIDQSDNIYISCLPDSIYKNMQIWTILFNIFDVSGWLLLANQDVELNIINNYGYNSNSNFDISLSKIEISGNSSISNDKFLLECSQNILSLKTTDIGTDISGEIVDNIYFNIKDDNGNILDSSMIYLHLTPFTGYELGLGDSSFNFIIKKTDNPNTTNLIIGNEKQVFAKIFPYGYNILQNVSYFNINNITIEENNLLKLDTSGVLIGKLNFLSS